MVTKSLLVSAAVAAVAQAANHKVTAGDTGYEPKEIQAAVGDTVEFIFAQSIHDVIKGDFDKPCMPVASGGFNSGFFVGGGDDGPTFTITVSTTDPIPFYCSVARHCQDGMVGVINPAGSITYANYQKAAAGVSAQSGTPEGDPFGGVSGSKPSNDDAPPAGTSTTTETGSDGDDGDSGSDSDGDAASTTSASSPSSSPSASASSAGSTPTGTPGAAGVVRASVLTLVGMLGTAFLLI